MKALLLKIGFFLCCFIPALSYAKSESTILAENTNIVVHPDKSVTTVSSIKQTLNTALAARDGQEASISYFPGFEDVKLVKAYAETPGGTITQVAANKVFIHPAPAAKDAPGFTKQRIKTVVFPQLVPGDTTFIEWKLIDKQSTPFVFTFFLEPNFSLPSKLTEAIIHLPKSMPFYWHGSKAFHVNVHDSETEHVISATITNQLGHTPQPRMISSSDLLPYFQVTTIPTWKDFGNTWWGFYKQQLIITPKVRAKALSIANGATGIEALRRFYGWISNYINYIDVSPDLKSNYIPHTPQEIIDNGYGDCKDYAMLMVAFSKVIGIKVSPAMINWGTKYRPYPLPTASSIDHAIVYVPKYKLFLNPTNIYATFGTLDDELRDKQALVLSDHSTLIETPIGNAKSNRIVMKMKTRVDENGDLMMLSTSNIYGSLSTRFREKSFYQGIKILFQSLANLTSNIVYVTKYSSHNLETLKEPLNLTVTMTAPDYLILKKTNYLDALVGANELEKQFINPYIFEAKRLYPLLIGAKTLSWDMKVKLPRHYTVQHLPDDFNFTGPAGKYSISITNHHTWYDVRASITINQDIYQASQYQALKELLFKPITLSRRVIVIEKK